jgi:hypothetical protein
MWTVASAGGVRVVRIRCEKNFFSIFKTAPFLFKQPVY